MKTHAARILREVRERKARYIITYRGRPIALLEPLEPAAVTGQAAHPGLPDAWDELVRLRRQIGKGWRARQTSVELLSVMRR